MVSGDIDRINFFHGFKYISYIFFLELKGIGHVFTSDSGRFFLTGTGKEQFKPADAVFGY